MKKYDFKGAFKKCEKQLKKHSPAIMTGLGVVGLATTAIFTGKATVKAVRLVDEAEMHKGEPLTKKEVLKTTWKCYIPAVATGAAATACIIGSSRVNMKRNAAIATAYQATQLAFSDYKEEVIKQIGEKKEQVVADKAIEKQTTDKTKVNDKVIVANSNSKQLFYDDWSGRYFESSINDIQRAVNRTNQRMLSQNYASINDYWDELPLNSTEPGGEKGWNIDDGLMDVDTSSCHITDDGRAAIEVIFDRKPKDNFDMFGY